MRQRHEQSAPGGKELRSTRWCPSLRGWSLLVSACLALSWGAGCREDRTNAEVARWTPEEVLGDSVWEAPPGALAACPCLVEVATTEIGEVPGGVTVTVRAQSEAAVAEIQARARLLSRVAGRTQSGGDPCPVVASRTTVAPEELPDGVSLLVKPRDAADLAWLRAETRERLRELTALHAEPVAGR
ncbi:hypothetical protein [Chondromyces crocatus]|uniref:hypothetical protein n=1 Tax=Chondromyces crocatus TaxID=52 RepID=UPI0012E2DFCC|nr:hypothetical protein [Chondromyces crocatus]